MIRRWPERFDLLIVEDDPLTARAVARVLKPHHTVRTAASVDAALKEIAVRAPQVVVSDFHLEWETGAKLLESIAQTHPTIRRILWSAASAETLQQLVDREVAETFLSKGCSLEQLRAAVAGESHAERPSELGASIVAEEEPRQLLAQLDQQLAAAKQALTESESGRESSCGREWTVYRRLAAIELRALSSTALATAAELERVGFVPCPACGGTGRAGRCGECRGTGEMIRIGARLRKIGA